MNESRAWSFPCTSVNDRQLILVTETLEIIYICIFLLRDNFTHLNYYCCFSLNEGWSGAGDTTVERIDPRVENPGY